jgi:hypothetical protein
MKKAILTIGLFSLVMVLTSFTTIETNNVNIIGGGSTSSGNMKLDIIGGGSTSSGNMKLDIIGGGSTSSGNMKLD